jgi:predicted nucleotidyltransferase
MTIHSITDTKKEKVKEKITYLLKSREEVLFSYIYGSFTEGDFRDVDIAVYLNDELESLPYELNMERRIEDAIAFPADVRILNHAPLSFRFNVIKNGFLLFSTNENIRCDFESLSIVEYHDFEYFRNIYRREALGI